MGIDKNYRILAVDDAKDTLMLLEFDLAEEGYDVYTADSGEQALSMIESQDIDLILLDMYMPGITGLELLTQLKQNPDYKNIPIIMLSASDDENQVVSALELGADDYVTKPYIAKVLLARMKTSLRLLEKTLELERLAKTDFLTKLSNKGGFEELAHKAVSQANRENQSLIMAMLDIDLFKHVNDTYGHEAGDVVLIEFAKRMRECFRDYDIVGRVGGEEFAICMPNISLDNAYNACERFRSLIEEQPISITQSCGKPHDLSITVSIGLIQGTSGQLEYEELLKQADVNLYEAKNSGRNTIKTSNGDQDISEIQEEQIVNTSDESQFPGIDMEIGVGNVLGDESLFKDIVHMFYEDHSKDGEKIKQAIEDSDQGACKHLVHTLKGVSCSVGAMNLFEHVKLLDVAINEHKTDEYLTLFSPVEHELALVMQGIEKALADRLS